MIHGTDWIEGPLAPYRSLAIKALKSYGGELTDRIYEKVSSQLSLKEK